MPNKIVIPDEEFFRLTQAIREQLPAEISEARAMIEKRDLILKNAQEEHKRIMDSAERRLEDLASEDTVVAVAKQEAERILESAAYESESIKRDAMVYTAELLSDIEKQFDTVIQTVRKSRSFLDQQINQDVEENLADINSLEDRLSGAGEGD